MLHKCMPRWLAAEASVGKVLKRFRLPQTAGVGSVTVAEDVAEMGSGSIRCRYTEVVMFDLVSTAELTASSAIVVFFLSSIVIETVRQRVWVACGAGCMVLPDSGGGCDWRVCASHWAGHSGSRHRRC